VRGCALDHPASGGLNPAALGWRVSGGAVAGRARPPRRGLAPWPPTIPQAQSLGDYFGRWLASQFCEGDVQAELGIRSADAASPPPGALSLFRGPRTAATGDTCPDCGGTLQRTGACQTCTSCGYNTDCA
jgi:hypothetical protein